MRIFCFLSFLACLNFFIIIFCWTDSLWAAQTGKQWTPKENGRGSPHQESRPGTAEVMFFDSTWFSLWQKKEFFILSLPYFVVFTFPYEKKGIWGLFIGVCVSVALVGFVGSSPRTSCGYSQTWQPLGWTADRNAFVFIFLGCFRLENQKLKELVTGGVSVAGSSAAPLDTEGADVREEPVREEAAAAVRPKMEVNTPQKVESLYVVALKIIILFSNLRLNADVLFQW